MGDQLRSIKIFALLGRLYIASARHIKQHLKLFISRPRALAPILLRGRMVWRRSQCSRHPLSQWLLGKISVKSPPKIFFHHSTPTLRLACNIVSLRTVNGHRTGEIMLVSIVSTSEIQLCRQRERQASFRACSEVAEQHNLDQWR